MAATINADLLILNHLSVKASKSEAGIQALVEEAKEALQQHMNRCAGQNKIRQTEVVASHDFMEVVIPRAGFERTQKEQQVDQGWRQWFSKWF